MNGLPVLAVQSQLKIRRLYTEQAIADNQVGGTVPK
jgi:hypothetical protein